MSRSISPFPQQKQVLPDPDAVLLMRLHRLAALMRRPPDPAASKGGEG